MSTAAVDTIDDVAGGPVSGVERITAVGTDKAAVESPRPLSRLTELAVLEPVLRLCLTMAAVAAPAAYAVCYLGLAAYYEPFGLSPADAGVTQTALLARAAGVVAAQASIIVLAALYTRTILRILRHLGVSQPWTLRHKRAVTVPAGAALMLLTLWLASTAPAVALAVLPALPALLLASSLHRNPPGARLTSLLKSRTAWLFGTALSVVVITFFVEFAAGGIAQRVVTTGSTRSEGFDELVRQALGLASPAVSDRCAVVLARSSGQTWVLEWHDDAIVVQAEPVGDVKLAPFSKPSCSP
jgi:hypothetical protein